MPTALEKYYDIPGYDGIYFINKIGEVKRIYKNKKEKILKPFFNRQGYSIVRLCKNGKKNMFTVHRLVCLTFLENTENKEQINHKNGIKDDNRVDNLEWCTRSENMLHSYKELGHKKSNYWGGIFGKESPCSKKINQYTKQGLLIKEWGGIREASKLTGIHFSSISKVCKGYRKTAGKYIWKFIY